MFFVQRSHTFLSQEADSSDKCLIMTEAQILHYENRLLAAMKSKDLETLHELLHDDLLFVIPNGQIITKAIDLENFEKGLLQLESIEGSHHRINLIGDTAVSTVQVRMKGTFADQAIDGTFQYIRIWKQFDDGCKVIGGSGIQLQAS